MALVPVSKVGKIQFFEDHIAPWTTNAVAIGTTAAAVTALQAKTEAARAAFDAQHAAQQAAKAATLAFNDAVEAMATAGADIIRQVRAKGAVDGNNVYVLAEIPAPATPAPKPAPGPCTNFAAELLANGSLELSWKCANPPGSTGTLYQMWRRDGLSGEFVYLGGSGDKKFLDATVPSGVRTLTYQIQAVRSTAIGPWMEYVVNLGTAAPGGVASATVTQATGTPKMAA